MFTHRSPIPSFAAVGASLFRRRRCNTCRRLARLVERYEKLQPNPFAEEVAAWLRGEYQIDPECLTA